MQSIIKSSELISLDKNKCVNCHRCISVCPVKYCNNASDLEEGIKINPDLCIACGECIKICSHEARELIDDTEKFFKDLNNGVKISTLIAPAVDANFPGQLEKLLGFFKNAGVENNFDVSLGAEITTFQYNKLLQSSVKTPLIAQPCPCIVNYIEIYKPTLIKYLAPINSPVMNIAKWVHTNKPFENLAFIGPCIAKKKEFEDINNEGLISYNITIYGLKKYLTKNSILIKDYYSAKFNSILEADKGILYSKPGGLTESLKKYNINLKRHQIRQVEGFEVYKETLNEIEEEIENNECDIILLDILNCTHGCNRGTGTNYKEWTTDDVLKTQFERLHKHQNKYYRSDSDNKKLEKFLKRIDYINFSRKYTNKSSLYKNLEDPTEEIIEIINREMGKFSEEDIKNCCTCGYNSCSDMVKAILNGLYRPQQCHHFLESFYKKHSGDET